MAQFIPFDNRVEVRGETVLAVVNGVEDFFKDEIISLLKKNNIENPLPANWYSQTDWLKTFRDINDIFGEFILYKIGKAIPDSAIFPQGIRNLKEALESIDVAYHNNHRNGEIGYYRLIEWTGKSALMECYNPYPCHFDRGIITRMAEKFKPIDSKTIEVSLDTSRENRLDGGDKSYYIVKW